MQGDMRAIIRGAVAGATATAAMSVAMALAQKAGLLGRMPPKRITTAALHAIGLHPSEPALAAATVAAHFGFGASVGALFGWARHRLPGPPPVLAGAAFGTAVWAASYQGWVPSLGIMPPPRRDRPGRPTSMLVAHWVYGATLGAVTALLAARDAVDRRQLSGPGSSPGADRRSGAP